MSSVRTSFPVGLWLLGQSLNDHAQSCLYRPIGTVLWYTSFYVDVHMSTFLYIILLPFFAIYAFYLYVTFCI